MMKFVKSIFTVIVATFLFLLFAEIAVKVYLCIKYHDIRYLKFDPRIKQRPEFPMPKIEEFGLYYKFRPGTYKTRLSFSPGAPIVEYRINSKGFRGNEFKEEKDTGTVRIFCFGGSSTMGANTPYNETYPRYLENFLNRKYGDKKFEVINVGLMGYVMQNIYHLFKNEIIDLEPDIITIYSAFNDASYERNLVAKKKDLALRLHNLLYYRWMLYTVSLERYSVMKNKNPIPEVGYSAYLPVHNYVKNLQNIIDLLRKENIKIFLIKQPINTGINIYFDEEDIESLQRKIKRSSSMREIRAYTQYMLVKEMERLGNDSGITLINPLQEFKKKKDIYFIDEVHLTPEGNKKLAEIIANTL